MRWGHGVLCVRILRSLSVQVLFFIFHDPDVPFMPALLLCVTITLQLRIPPLA